MADTANNERSSGADTGLDGLNAKDRQETESILNELDGEQAAKPGDDKPVDPNKPDEKDGGDEKPKGEDGKPKDPEGEGKPKEGDGEKPKPEVRRDPKLIPAWLHERQKAEWDKKEKDLLSQIEAAKSGSASGEGKGGAGKGGDAAPAGKELDTIAEEIAQKEGITPSLAKSLIEAGMKLSTLPTELKAEIDAFKAAKHAEQVTSEANQFNADFDRLIAPLVKGEYGADVPQATLDKIREDLKAKAYDPTYAKVPYTTIYKGEDEFRGLVAPGKKGAEPGRGGSTAAAEPAGGEGKPDLTKPLSDEAIRSLSDSDFDSYMKNMETFEKSQK